MAIFLYLLIPIFLVFLFVSAWKKKKRGIHLAIVVSFICTFSIGTWSILASRSSTAAIGFLFLPLYASIGGVFAWGYSFFKHSIDLKTKMISWISLMCLAILNLYLIFGGIKTIELNRKRDLEQNQRMEAINKNRFWIEENLKQHVGNEEAWFDQLSQEKSEDDKFILPMLEQKKISPTTLEKMANKTNHTGVILQIARHPNTPPAILEKIYRRQSPEYFFQALALNPNTPPEVLQKIYDNPSFMLNIDQSLAENPSIRKTTLKQIASKTKKVLTFHNTILNPVSDCEILKMVSDRVKSENLEDDFKGIDRLKEDLRIKMEFCSQIPTN